MPPSPVATSLAPPTIHPASHKRYTSPRRQPDHGQPFQVKTNRLSTSYTCSQPVRSHPQCAGQDDSEYWYGFSPCDLGVRGQKFVGTAEPLWMVYINS